MAVLVLLSYEKGDKIRPISRSAITAATQLDTEVHALLVGENLEILSQKASQLNGVQKLLVAEHSAYAHMPAEPVANLIASIAESYEFIIAPANAEGKDILPRLAGLLDVQPISDVVEIIDTSTFVRPIYAGSILATVASKDAKKLLSVRGTTFEAVAETGGSAVVEKIENLPLSEKQLSIFKELKLSQSDRPELEGARVVVSGGRGMQSAENFVLLEKIADQLEGAIGASRAAVDAGFVSNDFQVGQTGKIVAPELYIAVAISGAIQHLAGMKDSKIVVAINKDPEAPMFKVSDYGIVGDLFEILPQLEAALKAR
ncbi:electron transfer flavoprotein subunit alpha/FixB family protein [Commensalibacter papalotli (ex Botero et al. 2024)]|uniref:Alpha subunit FixB (FixB) (PDB:1EFP) n=1 Tax=Commensalibacter papalotli (ex Botero et al. 2024) TaxID=2972766 RepID=A0ABM9HRS4_9PROT|nr:FAD-binding protein [Commensalibacter papalotli (ex Botero et al. 2024)]CAI3940974.1 Electron transfer flavoprotein [Commensalibacter papalotli (ex Botero et al. 2024)]CAI3950043.1 Electron transfer flavoprotein [Commensalibacter papalotli (ex Botero et al. 2024)]